MATRRLTMRKIRDILRLKWSLGMSHRETARSLSVSSGVVAETLKRAKCAHLDWARVCELDDTELDKLLYGVKTQRGQERPRPDFAHVDIERRRPGVTLAMLHWEYLQEHPDGYQYARFCALFKEWRKNQRIAMRQVHVGGEKLFIDYSGKKPQVIDPKTGEVRNVELFVAVLGASSYTYAEASESQQSQDFIASHMRALEYFGGVPRVLVPDQLKSAVTRPGQYEPVVQRTYQDMAEHYDTVVIPARPRKPKDKAKVEVAVQIVQRFVLGALRKEQFFSLEALNQRIRERLEALNNSPMKKYNGASRRQLFERLDQPVLRPLPLERFVYATWKRVRVNIDYHVALDNHYYSVPYQLASEELEARQTATTVELFHKGKRVASHKRSRESGRHSTITEHMPKAHRAHLEWTPSRLLDWAGKMGPNIAALVQNILETRKHPEQGYRSCLGILRLAKRYDPERLDAACLRALRVGARSYRSVESILKTNLDRVPLPDDSAEREPLDHDNVRGPDYYLNSVH